uniref:Putative secreted protein n=1 Tax=Anopheles darlingi TaxID=43151 RepID=A0A2M4D8J7_ANODA
MLFHHFALNFALLAFLAPFRPGTNRSYITDLYDLLHYGNLRALDSVSKLTHLQVKARCSLLLFVFFCI